MDAKITLSFDKQVIEKAKLFAESQNISLSRLMELLLDKITSKQYASLEDLPVSDWVNLVAEGAASYNTKPKNEPLLKKNFTPKRNEDLFRCQCACFCA